MRRKINRVFLGDSQYSLLLYLLLCTQEKYEETFFYFSTGIAKEVRDNISNHYFFVPYKNKLRLRLIQFITYKLGLFRWPFLKNASFFGGDHLSFSSTILGENKLILIEDGMINYQNKINPPKSLPIVRFLFGPLYSMPKYGFNSCVQQIILMGLDEIPLAIMDKVVIMNLRKQWSQLTEDYKKTIFNIFNISDSDLNLLKRKKRILFTQCVSEDKIITEERKIQIYKDMIKDLRQDDLLIKPHPREVTNYKDIFPDVFVFDKKLPMQLLTLAGIKFDHCYSICSTAAFSFDYSIHHHLCGSEIDKNIADVYGIINPLED